MHLEQISLWLEIAFAGGQSPTLSSRDEKQERKIKLC